jgi:hypothetical protein
MNEKKVNVDISEMPIDMSDIPIDFSDIPEITDFSKAQKNPYYEKIRANGFTITERYSPEDVTEMINGVCRRDVKSLELDAEEQVAFDRYIEANKRYIRKYNSIETNKA